MANLITRTSTVLTMTFGFLFLSCNLEASNARSVFILGILTLVFGFISYNGLKNKSELEIKNIFGLTWLENKTGIKFTEE